jgi:hypothetical protein
MPFARCDHCRRALVLGDERLRLALCPFCSQPLRLVSRAEFFAPFRQANGAPPQADDNPATEPPSDAPDAQSVYTCVLAESEVVVLLNPPNERDRLAKKPAVRRRAVALRPAECPATRQEPDPAPLAA